ncbi:hypothetical protein [Variovorax sp. LjRoot175]|uniref:hypothetical protein n=1 Tax=Variovorax sp. LjRoot175 TaxID=3342276 RepID=UPI003F517C67
MRQNLILLLAERDRCLPPLWPALLHGSEIVARDKRRTTTLMRLATMPALKTLEQFDWSHAGGGAEGAEERVRRPPSAAEESTSTRLMMCSVAACPNIAPSS